MKWTLAIVEPLLREVRDDLTTGRIRPEEFDMELVFDVRACGSVGCIGGWVMHKYRVKNGLMPVRFVGLSEVTSDIMRDEDVERGAGLDSLFFRFPDRAGPADAVIAIDKYLDGNNDPWETAS